MKMLKHIFHTSLLCIAFSPVITHADDTEIYTGASITDADLLPNVLFIIDTSGSMSSTVTGTTTRLDIVKEAAASAVTETVESDEGYDFNIGLMSFDSSGSASGGQIDMVMTSIGDGFDTFETTIDSYSASGGTPITEVMDEAIRYFRGDEVEYGSNSIAASYTGSTYNSPITSECQENHIVLFSDGIPTYDVESNADILTDFNALEDTRKDTLLADSTVDQCNAQGAKAYATSSSYLGSTVTQNGITYYYDYSTSSGGGGRGGGGGSSTTYYYYYYDKSGYCAEELALLSQLEDLAPSIEGTQNVTFHTVGGFAGADALLKLKNIARYGSPLEDGADVMKTDDDGNSVPFNYYSADDSETLKDQFVTLLSFIASEGATFTAPAVSVNSFNRLTHNEELYYSVFNASDSADWNGNLKRYRLGSDGEIYDSQGDLAVDDDTGFFSDESHSYWTLGDNDGNTVTSGGIASRFVLPSDPSSTVPRMVTTYLAGTSTSTSLTDAANRVHPDNALLTNDVLGLDTNTSDTLRESILSWAAGIDVNNEDGDEEFTDVRPFMEDPLHSEPVIISYAEDTTNETTDSTIFLSTNSGYLHAFNPDEDSPEEWFSFIPEELLNINEAYYSKSTSKAYGLDGPLSYFHSDLNSNGVILDSSGDIEETNSTEEYIHLYSAMRRGGQNYYALDVSDRSDPKYLWQINGGVGDFEKLGQTWSKMVPAYVNWEGTTTRVLFFGGGYDDDTEDCTTVSSVQDCTLGPASRQEVTTGNAIFMVDALTGEYLWSASNKDADLNLSDMTSSLPSDLVVVDTDSDGLADLIYSSDTGGRVWRLDIDNSPTSGMVAYGGVIADLNESSNNIRFYTTPDISYINEPDSGISEHFQIALGSGYRAHPLDNRVENNFYMINDYKPFSKPTATTSSSFYDTINTSDLTEITAATTTTTTTVDSTPEGYYLELTDTGEKVLSGSLTTDGTTLFTTYRPNTEDVIINCEVNVGLTKLYEINLLEGTVTETDLAQTGIPPQPVILYPPDSDDAETGVGTDADANADSDPVIAIGAQIIDSTLDSSGQINRTHWRILQ